MKHHHHSQGWREANNMQRGAARREWLAIIIAHAGVVALVAVIFNMLI